MQLTLEDAVQLFGVPEKAVFRWIREEGLPCTRVRGDYRFERAELLEWAMARRIPVSPRICEDADAPRPTRLAAALEAGGIHHGVGGTDKASVLRHVVDLLPLGPDAVGAADAAGGMSRARLLESLLAREALGSTAVGDGIAIPHVRYPIVLRAPAPTVTLAFLAQPVPFDALDGGPVRVLFTLITPTVRAHLALLARIAFVTRDPAVRRALAAAAPRDAVLAAVAAAEATLAAPARAP